jgi:guanylate kinase
VDKKKSGAGDKTNGLLVIISGPSGVGKSTVVSKLLKMCPEIKFSISSTTRPKRPGEEHGKSYFFLSEREFSEKQKSGGFLEWAKVHAYTYGTPRDYIEAQLEQDNTVVLEVDVQGASTIKDLASTGKIKSGSQVFIFLIPPSVDILAFRLKKRRTEKKDEQNFRLRGAIAELQVMEKYDYIVVNDKVDTAAEKIKAIINVEKERMMLN